MSIEAMLMGMSVLDCGCVHGRRPGCCEYCAEAQDMERIQRFFDKDKPAKVRPAPDARVAAMYDEDSGDA